MSYGQIVQECVGRPVSAEELMERFRERARRGGAHGIIPDIGFENGLYVALGHLVEKNWLRETAQGNVVKYFSTQADAERAKSEGTLRGSVRDAQHENRR